MTELKHPWVSVWNGTGCSFGGSQRWLGRDYLQKCACGLIACTDLLWYLHRYRGGCAMELFADDNGIGPAGEGQYLQWVRAVQKKVLPVIPYVGTIGAEMAAGLNLYFRRSGVPLRASWGVRKGELWTRMEAMLANDLPVILAVGANVPLPVRYHKLPFYRPGESLPACRVCAHFVTVTAMDEVRLRISSWGRVYEIERQEFWDYARRHSTFFLSSILWVWPE